MIRFRIFILSSYLMVPVLMTMGQQLTGSETREPEIFLRPRNFNYHPFANRFASPTISHDQQLHRAPLQVESNNIYSPGPVQFVPVVDYRQQAPFDYHPYAALKTRNSFANRIPDENDVTAYSALARHAKKVLRPNPESAIRKYAFSYHADHDIAHSQQRSDQGEVSGIYQVQLPDGRTQIVKYIADDNGYRADVSYQIDGGQSSVAVHQQQPLANPPAVQPPPIIPIHEDPEPEAPRSYFSMTSTTSSPPSVQYKDFGLITGLPAPYGTVRTLVYGNQVPKQQGYIHYAPEYADEEPPLQSTASPYSESNVAVYYQN